MKKLLKIFHIYKTHVLNKDIYSFYSGPNVCNFLIIAMAKVRILASCKKWRSILVCN